MFLVFSVLSLKMFLTCSFQIQRFSRVAHIFEKFELTSLFCVDVKNHVNG